VFKSKQIYIKSKSCTVKLNLCKKCVYNRLKEYPDATAENIAADFGYGVRNVGYAIRFLKENGLLVRGARIKKVVG
jgi:hypothetical protein